MRVANPRLLVVITCKGRERDLAETLPITCRSLRDSRISHEVIVVDYGSPGDVVAAARQGPDEYATPMVVPRVACDAEAWNKPHAQNVGLRFARGSVRYVAMLDADLAVTAAWITGAVSTVDGGEYACHDGPCRCWGSIMLPYQVLVDLGGYDETWRTRGEDQNLFDRLQLVGWAKRSAGAPALSLDHSDSERMRFHDPETRTWDVHTAGEYHAQWRAYRSMNLKPVANVGREWGKATFEKITELP